eukprot:TRINITY_DN4096_c0_g1_i1.p5 TRINITY_DN4096_c0_g1~~TRINITY_DN4096_c0_g1_i1.p5  ORF type:complete len:109 (+),score=13.38 TRINITY_DN4096_c0_g1_i1:694-1020(+)
MQTFIAAFGMQVPEEFKVVGKEEEVKNYTEAESITVAESPLAWWNKNEEKIPIISAMAQDILAIPATSTPSERVFSKIGNIVDKRRQQLSARNVDLLIFLAHNQKLIN